jgi:hypothetical protein
MQGPQHDHANLLMVKVAIFPPEIWAGLSVEGRTLFLALQLQLYPSGCISLTEKKPDAFYQLANLLLLPVDTVKAGYSDLLARGWLRHYNGRLQDPEFLQAQATPKSNALRARMFRAKRRPLNLAA